MKFLAGMIIALLLVFLLSAAIIYGGYINMAATAKPSSLEEKIGHELFERSMEKRASDKKNPYPQTDTLALASGMDHYRENCVICHGAPGVEASEIAKGLNPPAPLLSEPKVQKMTDSQFYWTIENGIRMTGMPAFGPTHSPDEIWKITAFVRHLPEITSDEKNSLASYLAEQKSHHHEAEEAGSEQTQPQKPAQTQSQTDSHEDHTHD